ncbi:radical SAM protein [Candidatus Pacearchaeota archaeon]|nr:radical SAM protein [Candidatus Pacearchaeota archaeon]
MRMKKVVVPSNYDYVGVYLTNACHLSCPYCITEHHGASYSKQHFRQLTSTEWIEGLNRLHLPADVPITLQGGEPFLYKGIWQILENARHKIDILTALPPYLKKRHFLNLKTLDWNKRTAPYPTIRVSYHKGQHDYKKLIKRIAELQDILNIGLFFLDHPAYGEEEFAQVKECADKYGVELRRKEFLGRWNGDIYGTFLHKDACVGERKGIKVLCKNTVVPIAPEGTIYRCHSDLYFARKELALGNILDETFEFPVHHLYCENYGLCSECDVKIKTNHYQIYGYMSVDIEILDKGLNYELQKTENITHQSRVL